jgi:phage shock protein A
MCLSFHTIFAQVEEAVRARLSLEKEASLLRASNDNYAQQVDALTSQVSKLEVSIAEATEQNNLATTQLQQVRVQMFALMSVMPGVNCREY